jgi:hypothetical protein
MVIKKLMLALFAFVCIVLAVGFYLYNKPHRNISRVEPDFRITSKMLSDSYSKDEVLADGNYLGKVLELQGEVLSYEVSPSNLGVVVLVGNEFSAVRCDLSENEIHSGNRFTTGSQVTVRGICIGFLLDVNMRDCVIINE